MIPLTDVLPEDALRRYDEDGEPLYTTAERILMRMRWFDWASGDRIRESLGVEDNPRDCKVVGTAIQDLLAAGRLEKRGNGRGIVEYRLVPLVQAKPSNDEAAVRMCCCTRCPRPAADGKSKCNECLARDAAAKARRRAAKEAA